MTDQTENTGDGPEGEDAGKKRVLKARPGRLELKKTVGAGQVRQNFSHGRSKAVTVEVRRKRTFAKESSGVLGETPPTPSPVDVPQTAAVPADDNAADKSAPRRAVLKTLTEEEAAARARALKGARDTDSEASQIVERTTKGAEARRAALREDENQKLEEEHRREEESRQRREEEERRHREESETARKALKQAQRLVAKTEALADASAAAVESPNAPRKSAAAPAEKDDKAARRAAPSRPGARRGEPRRRTSKLTIAQALNDEERVRSLASVRRAREREKRAQSQPAEAAKVLHEVIIPESITVQELSNRMAERGVDVIKSLMKMGVMATMPQTIDSDTAELVDRKSVV